MTDCLFCKIASGEAPSEMVYQDDLVVAFKDIQPAAPIHLLVIPRKHIKSLAEVELEDQELLGHLLLVVKKLAIENDINEKGYKTIINTGTDGGQIIDHLHVHLLGGEKVNKLV